MDGREPKLTRRARREWWSVVDGREPELACRARRRGGVCISMQSLVKLIPTLTSLFANLLSNMMV